MKILYIHNDYAKPSGEEHASKSLAELLTENGHEVKFYRRSSAEIANSIMGKIKSFFAGIANPFAAKAIAKELDEYKPDLVQVQNIYPLLSPSIFKPIKRRNIPVVMRCPNYRLFCPNGICYNGDVCERCFGGKEWNCFLHNCAESRFKSLGYFIRGFAARISKRILNNVDMFIVQTEFQKNKFIEQGIAEEKIGILPGIMPNIELTEHWNEGSYVTFVGRVSPEKGIYEFLECAKAFPEIPFMVAGAYDNMPELLEISTPNVLWRGFLSGNDLRQAYIDSRIIVVPSKWYEGFPNVIVMGMMLAKPIVTTSIGATGSIIDNGENGLLFPPTDIVEFKNAIKKLYFDLELCEQMGLKGKGNALELYSREKIYIKLNNIYKQAKENSDTRKK